MPARIPMTQRQRAALLALPDSEAAVVRHYGLDAEDLAAIGRSEEHTSELQSLMRISYAVFCLKKKKNTQDTTNILRRSLTNSKNENQYAQYKQWHSQRK